MQFFKEGSIQLEDVHTSEGCCDKKDRHAQKDGMAKKSKAIDFIKRKVFTLNCYVVLDVVVV